MLFANQALSVYGIPGLTPEYVSKHSISGNRSHLCTAMEYFRFNRNGYFKCLVLKFNSMEVSNVKYFFMLSFTHLRR